MGAQCCRHCNASYYEISCMITQITKQNKKTIFNQSEFFLNITNEKLVWKWGRSINISFRMQ